MRYFNLGMFFVLEVKIIKLLLPTKMVVRYLKGMYMNIKMLKAAFAGLVLSVSGFANAGLITQTQTQTIDFEDFSFSFNVNDWVMGSESTLLLEVKSDFSVDASFEYFELIVEGISLGDWFNGNSDSKTSFEDTNTLINTYNFNTADTNNYLSDNVFAFDVNLSDEVHVQWGSQDGTPPYVMATYTYDSVGVPEPTTLAIFALGLIGLASRRFKKQS